MLPSMWLWNLRKRFDVSSAARCPSRPARSRSNVRVSVVWECGGSSCYYNMDNIKPFVAARPSVRRSTSRVKDLQNLFLKGGNIFIKLNLSYHISNMLYFTPTFEVHRVEGSKNLWFSKSYIFHPFQALYCRARCADSKKVSYVGVGPRKVGLKRTKLPLASAK